MDRLNKETALLFFRHMWCMIRMSPITNFMKNGDDYNKWYFDLYNIDDIQKYRSFICDYAENRRVINNGTCKCKYCPINWLSIYNDIPETLAIPVDNMCQSICTDGSYKYIGLYKRWIMSLESYIQSKSDIDYNTFRTISLQIAQLKERFVDESKYIPCIANNMSHLLK